MSLDPKSRARFNLSQTVVLLFDPQAAGLSILGEILRGLGARNILRCRTIEEAEKTVSESQIDLMIVDTVAESGAGFEFVRWLRKNTPQPNRHAPVLLTAAHTRSSDVSKTRDCGSHFLITKPLSPIVMLERIIWVAREGRPFLLSDNYIGPDRRFGKNDRPYHPRRRHDDPPEAATEEPASEPLGEGEAPIPFIDRPLERAS
ncbi:MAG TPA: response regulator [Caulobacteraceae bacterium]|jgi:DNA-binding response OmpR family regulator